MWTRFKARKTPCLGRDLGALARRELPEAQQARQGRFPQRRREGTVRDAHAAVEAQDLQSLAVL